MDVLKLIGVIVLVGRWVASVTGVVLIAALVVAALWFATHGRRGVALVCVALAAAPLVLFGLSVAAVKADVESRPRMLASLPRVTLGADRPRTLEIHGSGGDVMTTALLAGGVFDEIDSFDELYRPNRTMRGERLTPVRTPACVAAADRWMATPAASRSHEYATLDALKACVAKQAVTVEPGEPRPDAVLLLSGHATTLKRGHTLWAGGNLEVRLRRGGRDQLVDYWENQHVERPMSPFWLSPRGYQTQSEPGDPRPVDTLDFLLAAVQGQRYAAPTGRT